MPVRPYLVLAPALVVALSLSACAKKAAQPQGPPPASVTVAKATRGEIALTGTLNGQVTPLHQSMLSFQQSGAVTRVYVNAGDRVRAGELLARIDDSVLRAQLAQDEALIAESNARAAGSSVGVPITRAQTSAGLQAAKNALTADLAALTNAKLVYDQNVTLFRQGYVSQTQLEQSRASFVAADQRVAADRQALRAAQANTLQTQAQTATAAADRAAAQAAQAQAETLRAQIAQTSVRAPFDGVITARLLDPGANAGPSTPVLQISQIDTVYVDINVPDTDLAFVKPGTQVVFRTSSLPGKTFTGTIRNVNAVPSQGTLSYLAQIRRANPGDLLRGGMLVTVTFTKARHRDVVIVPHGALTQTQTGAPAVFVVQGGKAHEVPVTLGIQTDTESEVRGAGITAGTEVVTEPPATLHEGSVVIVGAPAAR